MRRWNATLAVVAALSTVAAAGIFTATGGSAGASATPTSTAVTTSLPPLPVPVPPPQDNEPEPQVYHGRIQIPAIDIDRPFIEGIRINTLDYGPGHWPGTAMPGEIGNAVVAGHRTSHNADFRRLDELQPGDQVIFDLDHVQGFTRADGVEVAALDPDQHAGRWVYVVNSVEIVPPDSLWVVDQALSDGIYRRTATLFACHPPGSVSERIVVHLDLADPETLQPLDPPRPTTTTTVPG